VVEPVERPSGYTGGFYIIEAPTRDAALEWGAKTAAAIEMPIEIRAFRGFRT